MIWAVDMIHNCHCTRYDRQSCSIFAFTVYSAYNCYNSHFLGPPQLACSPQKTFRYCWWKQYFTQISRLNFFSDLSKLLGFDLLDGRALCSKFKWSVTLPAYRPSPMVDGGMCHPHTAQLMGIRQLADIIWHVSHKAAAAAAAAVLRKRPSCLTSLHTSTLKPLVHAIKWCRLSTNSMQIYQTALYTKHIPGHLMYMTGRDSTLWSHRQSVLSSPPRLSNWRSDWQWLAGEPQTPQEYCCRHDAEKMHRDDTMATHHAP